MKRDEAILVMFCLKVQFAICGFDLLEENLHCSCTKSDCTCVAQLSILRGLVRSLCRF